MSIYRQLDAAVAAFAERTGLSCPQGCGHCCLSENVEATVLECLPLAFTLFRDGQADALLQQLEDAGDRGRCVLYRPDLTQAGLWGCSQYATRPVVCRLFGFAGNRDRDGVPRLAMCRVIAELSSSAAQTKLMPLRYIAELSSSAAQTKLMPLRFMKDPAGTGNPLPMIEDPQAPMPLFGEAGMRITALHPGLGTLRMPINAALRQALMKVGMVLDLESQD
ncbi:MAG: YkgJ family cysteine cluster protein [Desulforhopalus sp.]|nr:YkgJ family cysteine cluster protein [Desulforhopalus sp.]